MKQPDDLVNKIIQEIDRLSLPEKLLLVEDVWDSVALGNSALPIPQWQKEELDKRYNAYKQEKQPLHDWQAIHEVLRKDQAEQITSQLARG
ncbi:MAG: addiction module protein [Nitrospiria bacterium]